MWARHRSTVRTFWDPQRPAQDVCAPAFPVANKSIAILHTLSHADGLTASYSL